MTISYEKLEIPNNYTCSRCKAHGVKLWRQYNTMVSALALSCHKCAAPDVVVDTDGRSASSVNLGKTDQLEDVVGKTGSLVPAVPTVEADTYWGYSSVPLAGCAWWRALPNRPGDITRPFYISPEDLTLEQKMLDDRRSFEARPEQYKCDTVFLIEATSFEQHSLWCQYADEASIHSRLSEQRRQLMGMLPYFVTKDITADDDILFDRKKFLEAERRHRASLPQPTRRSLPRVKWEQLNPGSCPTVGTDNKLPICLTCFWVRIDGQVVMFYSATSRLVDWKKIEEWLDKEYPEIRRTDAQNFHNCLRAIDAINERQLKKEAV